MLHLGCFFWVLGLFQFPFALSAEEPAEVYIHAIDVGYGDSFLLEFKGGPILLIDGGYAHHGEKVARYLRSQNIKQLDVVVLTHSHPDHSGGLQEILQSFKVGRIWTNGEWVDWLDQIARQQGIEFLALKKGDIISLDSGIEVRVLNSWEEGLDPNEGSLALIFSSTRKADKQVGGHRLFFAGDIAPNVQKGLLDSGQDLSAEFLKVPHHGWGVLPEFLRTVNPKEALISVGKNPYGAPEKEVLQVLSQMGSKIYRTDLDGTVVIKIRSEKSNIEKT